MKTRHLGEFESHAGCAAIARAVARSREAGRDALAAPDLHERAQLLRRLGKDLLKVPEGVGLEGPLAMAASMAAACPRDYPSGKLIPCGQPREAGDALTQRVMMPRAGVAFLCGSDAPQMIEAMGAAILSGLPCLFCAPEHGPLAGLAETIAARGLLPKGALQAIAASPAELAPHLSPEDVICLSRLTPGAFALQHHPLIAAGEVMLERSAQGQMLAILGPDLGPDSPALRDFIDQALSHTTPGLPAPMVILPRELSRALAGLDVLLAPYDAPEQAAALARRACPGDLHLISQDEGFLCGTLRALGGHVGKAVLDQTTRVSPCSDRALRFMVRVEITAAPARMTELTGIWHPGAPVRQDGHPFRKVLGALCPGDRLVTASRRITQADVEHFAHLTGDLFYAHMDAEAARAHPFFEDRVAHGQLVVSFANGLLVDPAPGPVLANLGSDALRFYAPVYFGTALHVEMTCKQIIPRPGADFGEVRWACRVLDDKGRLAAQYDLLTLVRKQWPEPATVGV
ncbi:MULTISPECIES: MaoC/PaaZ C-terminal domain-containing protein [Paracoccus]|jgi:acyl dehydratase|uniref:MaoC/PaaZ C-terminal domain-containing protein n=1 Tax=Paracoccus TaxID=265 RepID=UPI003364C3E0